MEHNKQCYSELYDLVSERMTDVGEKMEFRKETLLAAAGQHGQRVDVSKWKDYSNDTFLEIAYMQLLDRLPDKLALSRWKRVLSVNHAGIKGQIINSIVNSQEFMMKNTYVEHNIYKSNTHKNIGKRIWAREYLIQIYRKFPIPVKNAIKKLLRVY